MSESLGVFMKIAIAVVTIATLLFGAAYTMLDDETDEYDTYIKSNIDTHFLEGGDG